MTWSEQEVRSLEASTVEGGGEDSKEWASAAAGRITGTGRSPPAGAVARGGGFDAVAVALGCGRWCAVRWGAGQDRGVHAHFCAYRSVKMYFVQDESAKLSNTNLDKLCTIG
jgi:hypothetical protein